MDAYDSLVERAAEKRDQAIQLAKDNYRREVAKIRALRKVQQKPLPKRTARVWDAVCESIPPDEPFNLAALVARIEASYPNQGFNRETIKRNIQRLCQAGELRRLGRDRQGRMRWAAATCDAPANQYGNTPASDLIADILRGSRPMRPVELVLALQDRGYRQRDNPRKVLHAIRKALYDNPERFGVNGDGTWAVV